jgi:hypothetical protein
MGRELLVIPDQISRRRDTLPSIFDQDAAMKQRWTVQEIAASLEEQAAFPRDHEAFHARRAPSGETAGARDGVGGAGAPAGSRSSNPG